MCSSDLYYQEGLSTEYRDRIVVESTNLCIHAIIFIGSFCLLSWCGLGACRACHDKAKFTENGFHMRLHLRFRYWRFCWFNRAEGFSLAYLRKISNAEDAK